MRWDYKNYYTRTILQHFIPKLLETGLIYFDNKHESAENIAYCKKIIDIYFEYKRLTHPWVQLPISLLSDMTKKGEIIIREGFTYKNERDETYM